MEHLSKIATFVGMGITISVFILFLYAFIPNMIQNNPWDNVEIIYPSGDEIYEMFTQEPAYAAFYDRYPNATEAFRDRGEGRAELELALGDFGKGKYIRLTLDYDRHDKIVWPRIHCEDFAAPSDYRHQSFDGALVMQFIEQNKCLEGGVYMGNAEPEPKITIPLACGHGTSLVDGTCVLN